MGAAGLIDDDNLHKALDVALASQKPEQWYVFLYRFLIYGGVLSGTVGVIFFFAYNWATMHHIFKFAIVELLMLASGIAYLFHLPRKLTPTITLTGMSLLTGALLAHIGQAYQTGADPWQLFALWAVIMTPWACLARSSALWLLWLVLCNLTLYIYLITFHKIFALVLVDGEFLWLLLGLNTLMAITFELAAKSNVRVARMQGMHPFITSRTAARVATLAAGFNATALAFNALFSDILLGLFAYGLWVAACLLWHRLIIRDLPMLAACLLSIILIATSLLVKHIAPVAAWTLLVIAIVVIAMSSVAALWLRKLAAAPNQVNRVGT